MSGNSVADVGSAEHDAENRLRDQYKPRGKEDSSACGIAVGEAEGQHEHDGHDAERGLKLTRPGGTARVRIYGRIEVRAG